MKNEFARLKAACYTSNLSMSVVATLSPLLFLTFRSMYGISYSLLGLLVLVNYCTQLGIDLVFSFFSHKFNMEKTVKSIPVICTLGLVLYSLSPVIFGESVYIGLLLSTVIFSAAAGLGEVLISPVIAAIPAKDPDREMSKLHSVYAWGVVGVVIFSTVFMLVFGSECWQFLSATLALIPVSSIVLYAGAKIPKMETPERVSGVLKELKNKSLWMSFFAIFFGGAAECTMAQWSSGYLEMALGIPKVWGDVFGVAFFAVMLGIGRSTYAKMGKNIERVLFFGMCGAVLCYLVAAISPIPVVGLIACAMCGLCTSMLWPGTLIVAANRIPAGGVFMYAMLAAGGDLGASLVPQLVGIVTDAASKIPGAVDLAKNFSLTADQLGMKAGLLVATVFCLVSLPLFAYILKTKKRGTPPENN